jgi:hypothetical protein
MKRKTNITAYIIHSIAAIALLVTAQISLASSASWLLSPQDSAWENVNNWTPGGPPNGPSDIAMFAQSSRTSVNISTPEEVNSIVFTSNSASYHFSISWPGQLIIGGTGVTNNNSVLQAFETNGGQLIFNSTSTAARAHMSIFNASDSFGSQGHTIFNDASSAAGASITNTGSWGGFFGPDAPGATIFNGTSTAGHATITNVGPFLFFGSGGSPASTIHRLPGTQPWSLKSVMTPLKAVRLCLMMLRALATQSLSLVEALMEMTTQLAVILFLTMLRRAAPRGWRFFTMVTWTLAAVDRA